MLYTKPNDIKAIKKFFTNIEVPFTFADLNARIERERQVYDYIDDFFNRVKLIDFLEKKFDVGIIGNSGKQMIFKFLGDRDLTATSNMIIHRPLRNLFAVKSHDEN